MLDTFVADNREEIIRRCRSKVERRPIPAPTPFALDYGVPRFLDQLIDALRRRLSSSGDIGTSAALHGRDLQMQGFTVSQVVHSYGDICQSISDLALQLETPISVGEFRTLNACLDDAIASAVTEFARGSGAARDAESAKDDERFGFFAHEIRNLVGTASLAFEALRTGNVGVGGSTGGVLQRSLLALRHLVERSMDDVRFGQSRPRPVAFSIADLVAELAPAAMLDASTRGLRFTTQVDDTDVRVEGDRSILAEVVMNLVQNAFKFTRPGTAVALRVTATNYRVLIEVEDQCGGLPDEHAGSVEQPFEQRHADRSGLGLGLAISRQGVAVNNGLLRVRNMPGRGCVFVVDLPKLTSAAAVGTARTQV